MSWWHAVWWLSDCPLCWEGESNELRDESYGHPVVHERGLLRILTVGAMLTPE
eukprot:m.72500 g.72500  ORF g.72500 m.72500 type:complete len:53 (-) comp16103_c0_seq1:571-729(-)